MVGLGPRFRMVSAPVDVGKPRPLYLWEIAGDQPLTEHEALRRQGERYAAAKAA